MGRFSLTPSMRGALWKFFSIACAVVATVLCFGLARTGEPIPPFQLAFLQVFLPLLFLGGVEWWHAMRHAMGHAMGRVTELSTQSTAKESLTRGFLRLLLTEAPICALGRAGCACVGFLAWFWSLRLLPLGILAIFRLLGPLLGFGGAILLLRERPSWTQFWAFVGALAGTGLLIQRELLGEVWVLEVPTLEVSLATGVLLPLVATIGFAGANIFAKNLLKKASPQEATLSLLLISSIVLMGFALPVWIWPTHSQWGILLVVGGVDALMQWSLSKALSLTNLSLLVALSLWRFALTALSGVLFFGEPLHASLWWGVMIIAVMTGIALRKDA